MPFYAWIPILPLAAFLALLLLGRRATTWAHWVAVPAAGVSFALAILAVARVYAGAPMHVTFSWAPVGAAVIRFGMQVDALTAVMLVVVTVVAFLVMVYSIGYMHSEARYSWYYAALSLFTASMLTLVLADDYLLMYMAWEGVGLCSYLLIGFWFEDPEPQEASKKAFIVTRLGDVGFGLAVVAIFALAGTLTFDGVFRSAVGWAPGAVTMVALLLFMGAMGKSAQFPLHVWLPDAMAGPTPVSALIHAATMVAAGVYLVARTMPLFEMSEAAMTVVLVIGGLTAIGAALSALVAYDIKKVLAYSTISQLGYMMMALGAGGFVAGMFHLTTHAFFKALLFLGSGSVIHATNTQDIRNMGGLKDRMPWTTWTFVIGSLALAGILPFSGFFSKDEVLAAIAGAKTPEVLFGVNVHEVVFAVAIATGALTAFYMSRLCFRVFWGEPVHAHESPVSMTVPLVALAVPAALAGLPPLAHQFALFIAPLEEPEAIVWAIALPATLLAVGAILLGYVVYYRKRVTMEAVKERFRVPYLMLVNKFFIDEFYLAWIVKPVLALCEVLARFDNGGIDWIVNATARFTVWASQVQRLFDEHVIDRVVNWTSDVVLGGSRSLRRVQSGSLQAYVQLMLGALVVFMLWFVLKGA